MSLTYTLRLLAQHEHAADRLHRELDRVLAGRTPSMADLPDLPYTRAVIDEALRLYPPAWAFGRSPVSDVIVGGVRVPKGTQVIICPWVLHRDARFFADPLRFAPERWIDGPAPPRFAYLPFGRHNEGDWRSRVGRNWDESMHFAACRGSGAPICSAWRGGGCSEYVPTLGETQGFLVGFAQGSGRSERSVESIPSGAHRNERRQTHRARESRLREPDQPLEFMAKVAA